MPAASSAGRTKPPWVESESADHQILATQSAGRSENFPVAGRARATRSRSARVPVLSASVFDLRSMSSVQMLCSSGRPERRSDPRASTRVGARLRILEISAGSVSVETTVRDARPD